MPTPVPNLHPPAKLKIRHFTHFWVITLGIFLIVSSILNYLFILIFGKKQIINSNHEIINEKYKQCLVKAAEITFSQKNNLDNFMKNLENGSSDALWSQLQSTGGIFSEIPTPELNSTTNTIPNILNHKCTQWREYQLSQLEDLVIFDFFKIEFALLYLLILNGIFLLFYAFQTNSKILQPENLLNLPHQNRLGEEQHPNSQHCCQRWCCSLHTCKHILTYSVYFINFIITFVNFTGSLALLISNYTEYHLSLFSLIYFVVKYLVIFFLNYRGIFK